MASALQLHRLAWLALTTLLLIVVGIALLLIWPPVGLAAEHPPTAVNLPVVETAVDQYLASMPGDFYAISTVSALKKQIASHQPLLIDVRNPKEYALGHLPGAINLPLQDIALHSDVIPADQDAVLYCSTGYRSAMGVMALRLQGFDHVSGFPPSFAGWEAAGEPIARSAASGRGQA